MSQFIFMNEQIRKANPKLPVIVCQDALGEQRESNAFALYLHGQFIGYVRFDRGGLKACETHDVKAWVELEDNIEVKACSVIDVTDELLEQMREGRPEPVATAKLPNQKIKT